MKKQKSVYVAGHGGMVGSALVRLLNKKKDIKVLTKSRKDLDLTNQYEVRDFFEEQDIDEVYLAAAKVGGVIANNTYPADFIYENLMIQLNIIKGAFDAGVEKLLFLGSSCIYPKYAEQPMSESALLTGFLEPTNEPYAIAKIAGIKLCESFNRQFNVDYRSVMPTNLYGVGDNFHSENSHVIPGLIRRFHEAKLEQKEEVIAWGTGSPMREFLHVDDMAAASIFVMNISKYVYEANTEPMRSHINVGTGLDCTIKKLTEIIAEVVGFEGNIKWDTSKPDGSPRKLMDISRLKSMGWSAEIDLKVGLEKTYKWFLANQDKYRA